MIFLFFFRFGEMTSAFTVQIKLSGAFSQSGANQISMVKRQKLFSKKLLSSTYSIPVTNLHMPL